MRYHGQFAPNARGRARVVPERAAAVQAPSATQDRFLRICREPAARPPRRSRSRRAPARRRMSCSLVCRRDREGREGAEGTRECEGPRESAAHASPSPAITDRSVTLSQSFAPCAHGASYGQKERVHRSVAPHLRGTCDDRYFTIRLFFTSRTPETWPATFPALSTMSFESTKPLSSTTPLYVLTLIWSVFNAGSWRMAALTLAVIAESSTYSPVLSWVRVEEQPEERCSRAQDARGGGRAQYVSPHECSPFSIAREA